MRERSESTEALLLRSVDYGEADRIVTLLTVAHGKIGLMARGARKSRRRFASALEPFTVLEAEVASASKQLGTLAGATPRRSFPRILRDLARMGAAGAVLELVREVVPEREPDATIFETTVAALDALDEADVDPLALLTAFHVRLMTLAGFAPRLDACGSCGKRPRDDQASLFDARSGALACRDCGGGAHRLEADARVRLTLAAGRDWVGAARAAWPRDALTAAYRAVHAFVEHRLGRELGDPALLLG